MSTYCRWPIQTAHCTGDMQLSCFSPGVMLWPQVSIPHIRQGGLGAAATFFTGAQGGPCTGGMALIFSVSSMCSFIHSVHIYWAPATFKALGHLLTFCLPFCGPTNLLSSMSDLTLVLPQASQSGGHNHIATPSPMQFALHAISTHLKILHSKQIWSCWAVSLLMSSVQFSSVAQSCPTLCSPRNTCLWALWGQGVWVIGTRTGLDTIQ